MEKERKTKMYLIVCTAFILFCGLMAASIQTNFNTIDVDEVKIQRDDGSLLLGKLFRPKDVDAVNTAPGILGLHGYNNDKNIQRGTALELAKAGFVVLIIDELGHGDSDGPGYFDVACALDAYDWLEAQPFVNGSSVYGETMMGIYGHSMGYIVGWQVALNRPTHDACAFESFAPQSNLLLHNVLHTWAEYEEWYDVDLNLFSLDYYTPNMSVKEVKEMGLIITGMNAGLIGPGEVDTTYGDFSLGTAFRTHYAQGVTHPGLTMDPTCNKEIVAWFLQALTGETEADAMSTAAISGQTYIGVEVFQCLALLTTFASLIFLTKWLLMTNFFKEVVQPMPERTTFISEKKWAWWAAATVNNVIAAFAYIFCVNANEAWNIDTEAPLLMGMMNNLLGFYLYCSLIGLIFVAVWYFVTWYQDRGSIAPYDLGITYGKENKKEALRIFLKTCLIAVILFTWMYLLVSIFQTFFLIEFGVFWTFMKMFTLERLFMFFLYLPMILPFFLIIGGVFAFAELRQKETSSGIKTQLVWWAKLSYTMVFGLFIVFIIQYAGLWLGQNPTFKGLETSPVMPLQLWAIVPLTMLILFFMVFWYRKTGKIYLGTIMASLITTWFLVVSGIMGSSLL
ncbi:MAG: alpha/beta hydrolase family protein [Candidatus Odinarchaeota archaeon]